MKHLFIVNPASGDGKKHKSLIEDIHRVCKEKGLDYDVRMTEYAGHAKWLVKSEALTCKDEIRVYACGGDGTVNEVASGLVEAGRGELAVIPVGTGNDFVKSFSPDGEYLSLENQLCGKSVAVDAVSAGESVFVNMLNSGFDSAVVSTIARLRDKSRSMRGKFAYIIGVAINFFKMPKTSLCCEFDDGEVLEGEFQLAAFSNGQYYGGGFKPLEIARPDDGILDVIFVRPCPRTVFLRLIAKYKNGTVLKSPLSKKYVITKRCKRAKLSFSPSSDVCVDGELVKMRNFDIEIIPRSLKLSLPLKVQL